MDLSPKNEYRDAGSADRLEHTGAVWDTARRKARWTGFVQLLGLIPLFFFVCLFFGWIEVVYTCFLRHFSWSVVYMPFVCFGLAGVCILLFADPSARFSARLRAIWLILPFYGLVTAAAAAIAGLTAQSKMPRASAARIPILTGCVLVLMFVVLLLWVLIRHRCGLPAFSSPHRKRHSDQIPDFVWLPAKAAGTTFCRRCGQSFSSDLSSCPRCGTAVLTLPAVPDIRSL